MKCLGAGVQDVPSLVPRPYWPDSLKVCGGGKKPRRVMTDEPGGPMAGRQEEVEPIRRPAGQDCS